MTNLCIPLGDSVIYTRFVDMVWVEEGEKAGVNERM